MKHQVLALSIIVCTIPGCDFAKNVVWPTAVTCGSQAASDLFSQVRGVVEADGFADEFSDASERGLDDLALSYGAQAVACVLHALLDKYTPRGVDDPYMPVEDVKRSVRVRRFLTDHDIVVSTETP